MSGSALSNSSVSTALDIRVGAARIITIILWASAFAGIRAGLQFYDPAHLALLRYIFASLAMAVYALVSGVRVPALRDIPGILLTGFVGVTVYHTALNYGETRVTAGAASLLVGSTPIFTALLAVLFLRERLKPIGWIGIVISFGGVALIALGEGGGIYLDVNAWVILIAAAFQAGYFVLQKPFLVRYTALEFSAYAIWSGTLFMAIFLPGTMEEVVSAPLDATLAVAYLGLFPSAVAQVTWAYTLARARASNAASYLYLIPATAIGIAWVWIGEIPSMLSLVGGVVALAGVILVNTRGR